MVFVDEFKSYSLFPDPVPRLNLDDFKACGRPGHCGVELDQRRSQGLLLIQMLSMKLSSMLYIEAYARFFFRYSLCSVLALPKSQ